MYNSGYPLHRVNRENGKKDSLLGKTGNLEILLKKNKQGIWFAQVVKSLLLMVNHISIFASKIFNFF